MTQKTLININRGLFCILSKVLTIVFVLNELRLHDFCIRFLTSYII